MKDRKKDHIDLAFKSQTLVAVKDTRFIYEPMLSAHPGEIIPESGFAGKVMRLPIWVSSMTGGTKLAGKINRNLARACREFGMGLGLGSCRILLDDDTYLPDFDIREIMGDELPLFANLGINQVEGLIERKMSGKAEELVEKLRADGLIVHVNPFQEWFQPEGDRLRHPPIDTIRELLELISVPLVVKEVGQGIGMESLRELLKLPLAAIEFGAFGGTNFAKVELLRNPGLPRELFEPMSLIGHDAAEMVDMINLIMDEEKNSIKCRQLIISGGIRSFLDGYYLMKKSGLPSVYGQASAFLKYAREDYQQLQNFVSHQVKGLQMAYAFLRVR